ncbi:MAG: hypothetical protein MUQ59_11145, partial [Loktanella sp.]|nr:hypothetical protein [Loktanella sp.]
FRIRGFDVSDFEGARSDHVTKVHLTGLKHAAQKTGLVDVLREGNIVHQPFPASDGKALVKKMKASMPTKCASQLPELQ